jgi:hypothetical protein
MDYIAVDMSVYYFEKRPGILHKIESYEAFMKLPFLRRIELADQVVFMGTGNVVKNRLGRKMLALSKLDEVTAPDLFDHLSMAS